MDPGPFLFLHGYLGSEPGHWQRWLAARLAAAGAGVAFPDLPDPERPSLRRWLATLDAALAGAGPGATDRLTVVAHSLGCLLWLHRAAAAPAPAVGRVLLVAPPSAAAAPPALARFFPAPLDATAIQAAAGETRLAVASNDPWCPEGAEAAYARPLGLAPDRLGPAGHVNPDSGYGPWPQCEAWCLGAAARIAPRAQSSGAKNGSET